jgi:hypothetical protein
MDIRDEGPEQTAVRMFNLLKVLKYKPPDDNMYNFFLKFIFIELTLYYYF